jgi:FYVE/RhoGEF/PH domain-containing protein 5/6
VQTRKCSNPLLNLYLADEKERDEWTSEIRAAKQQLFISLNMMNPNSTLTSSSSTNHVRRVLQALPYHPSDERVTTMKTSGSIDILHHSSVPLRLGNFGGKKDKAKEKDADKDKRNRDVSVERRRRVEHWVPPVWIPDSKTSSCMRCGRMFGWRRRRHHCRLCGRCICAGCSERVSAS